MAEPMDDVTTHPTSQSQSQGHGQANTQSYDNDDAKDQSIMLPPGPWRQRLRILPGDSPTAASFEIMHEDHTLGNVLRWVIARNPDVEFVGYTIPHPSDPKMHLRVQTYDNVNVLDVLEKGLDDLMGVCDAVTEKFEEARDEVGKEG